MTSDKDSQPQARKDKSFETTVTPDAVSHVAGSFDTAATIPPDCDPSALGQQQPGSGGFAVPQHFDGYELLDEIARGGMGIVYRAHQKNLDRIVALKTVLAGDLASKDAIQQIHSEAQAAGQLNHPGIVPVHDVGQCHGFHYFSMPLIEGSSLSDRIVRGPMDPDEAAGFIRSAAATIHFAHQKNIIHRDLKPGNILIDGQQQPLITDFGIATRINNDQTPDNVNTLSGTAEYMSPEQASGEPAGPLTDVYSLGATLYCLLTGHPPFQAATTLDTLLAVLKSDPVPPRRLNQKIPRDIELICLKCLEKRPQDRYQSALEVSEELDRFLKGEPVHVHPVGNIGTYARWVRRQPGNAAVATGLVLCFTAALAISIYYNFQLQMQRDIADRALEEVSLSEVRERRAHRTATALLNELASAESGFTMALQYSTLGEVCDAAVKASMDTTADERNRLNNAFRRARMNLTSDQETQLAAALDKCRTSFGTPAAEEAVTELIAQARELWRHSTDQTPAARTQIQTVLYARSRQLAKSIRTAKNRNEAHDDIRSIADLISAELSIVADDKIYSTARKMLDAIDEWPNGAPPESLQDIARALSQAAGGASERE